MTIDEQGQAILRIPVSTLRRLELVAKQRGVSVDQIVYSAVMAELIIYESGIVPMSRLTQADLLAAEVEAYLRNNQ